MSVRHGIDTWRIHRDFPSCISAAGRLVRSVLSICLYRQFKGLTLLGLLVYRQVHRLRRRSFKGKGDTGIAVGLTEVGSVY